MSTLLPEPRRERWQPLRLGLVDLYHYDVEEFWFEDGHLLLRGNNGTGKSKVLSLTLPFLLDASLASSRVEPDGDRGKRMDWNLLMGKLERRLGYAWIEFGRVEAGGAAQFLTLGCGMQAVAGRPRLDHWFFLTPQRVTQDFALVSPARTALTREQLGEALAGRGQIYTAAQDYRRAVDERLFRLGEQRYTALMDTLIQLRQPQLSKRPDESLLSDALAESLPPLDARLLDVVAEAMNQLDDYRSELDGIQRLRGAVSDFGTRYRRYARVQARRRARELRQAQTAFDNASAAVNATVAALAAARDDAAQQEQHCEMRDQSLRRDRAALEVFRSDPVMRDAQRLQDAGRAAAQAQQEVAQTAQQAEAAQRRAAEGRRLAAQRASQAAQAEAQYQQTLQQAVAGADSCGLQPDLRQALQDVATPEALQTSLRAAAQRRQTHLGQLRKRLDQRDAASTQRERLDGQRNDRAAAHEDAEREARAAHAALQRSAQQHLQDWREHLAQLRELAVPATDEVLAALADWVDSLAGAHPLRAWVLPLHAAALQRLAQARGELRRQQDELRREEQSLAAEQRALEAGEDRQPPTPYTRDLEARARHAGAPLWQLLEFRPEIAAPARAGIEAALEAAGLLDAWITPAGQLLDPATQDAWLVARNACPQNLAACLQPATNAAVPADVLQAVLASISCGNEDDAQAEAWISPQGDFRLGPLRGRYSKPQAEYLGYAARQAARRRRLAEIAARQAELAAAREQLQQALSLLDARQQVLDQEWSGAPTDDALRAAQGRFTVCEQARRAAQERLAQAESLLQEAEQRLRQMQRELEADAADLQLPATREALQAVESALGEFRLAVQALLQGLREQQRTQAELAAQREREEHTAGETRDLFEALLRRREAAQEAVARYEALRESVGAKVEELQARIAAIEKAVVQDERDLRSGQQQLAAARAAVARGEEKHSADQRFLDERIGDRQQTIARLQGFAATGLFAEAVADIELPAVAAWGIEAALSVARAAEQALSQVPAEDADWKRIQDQISQDYTSLGQALSALGQQAQAETSDYGLIVHIVYQNRAERPGTLEQVLDAEIEQRRGILSAKERQVLEDHLQAEVASSLQRLMREAEARVQRINTELERRPTSTGVRYKLDWEPRPESGEGAPVGLAEARRRLLRQSHDVWSPEDRRQVGDFLQQRIATQRAADTTGTLAEHLRLALDYRHWHRFRVKRWQDGSWKPLTGPASSGERALGLTMPLFAAASSHYDNRDWPHAPRLVLLDEAFAGIDDAARRDCMGLIREFDLDFVMTSEREWGCYDTLPGVAICQLLRREGVDAVHVSRWIWNGRARQAADGAGESPR